MSVTADYQDAGENDVALVRTRRACRRYLNKDVDKKIIKELMGVFNMHQLVAISES